MWRSQFIGYLIPSASSECHDKILYSCHKTTLNTTFFLRGHLVVGRQFSWSPQPLMLSQHCLTSSWPRESCSHGTKRRKRKKILQSMEKSCQWMTSITSPDWNSNHNEYAINQNQNPQPLYFILPGIPFYVSQHTPLYWDCESHFVLNQLVFRLKFLALIY